MGQLKGIPLCSNQMRNHVKACLSLFDRGNMWFKSNPYPLEGLWFL